MVELTERKPPGYWNDINNQKKWFHDFRLLNKFIEFESLYKVTGKMISENGGHGLFLKYNYSIPSILLSLYPEYDWKTYKFSKKPKGWWNEIENQIMWFNDMRIFYELDSNEDLYNLTNKMINDYYGANIMHIYKKIPNLLSTLAPEYNWKFYKLRKSRSFWNDTENQKLWLNDLREYYDYDDFESLYEINAEKIMNFYGGGFLINIHAGSPISIVTELIPEFNWKIYKFTNTPNGWWNQRENLLSWFNDLKAHYDMNTNEDLYTLNIGMILDYYGRSPLEKYNSSKIDLIRDLMPEYDWKEYKFTQTRKNYWDDIDNQKSWFKDLREHYGLKTYDSLYKVTQKMLHNYYGSGILTRKNGFYAGNPALLIQALYPEYDWDISKFSSNRKTQKLLFDMIKNHYPDTIWEYRTDISWHKDQPRFKIGFDIYIPSLRLAFEGQGHQHYSSIEMWGGDEALESQIIRDKQKSDVAKKLQIKLVIVPFCDFDKKIPRWDMSWKSLEEICKIQNVHLNI